MTKEDIICRVWENLGLNKKQAADVVDLLIDQIKDVLRREENLKIGGFGVFEVRVRKPRMGRNPKTGREAAITEGKAIKFKPGKTLKEAICK